MRNLLSTPLLARHDRPVPASYRVGGVIVSIVVLLCFATVQWTPWFVVDWAWTASYDPNDPFGASGPARVLLGSLFAAPVVAATWLAFRWPLLATVIAVLPALITWMDGQENAQMHFGTFAGLVGVTLACTWRRPVASAVTTAVAVVVAWLWLASDKDMIAPFGALISIDYYGGARTVQLGAVYTAALLLVLGTGLVMRRSALREDQRRTLAARAGEVEGEAAIVAERARLARDLHDVVAHHVSLIAVRAETAPYTEPELGDAGKRVLTDVAADARLALDELRGVLGILGRSGDAERSPQPTWSDIPALVERSRAAGMDLALEGDVDAVVAAGPGYAAYRVVQEALTNARRHAPDQPVRVRLGATGQLITVQVSNPVAGGAARGTGHGLAGMQERIEGLGGRIRVRDDDVFEIDVALPQGVAA